MAITTYSDTPHFDDFDQDNKYLRILFRPGRSVQVRELNQLQSNIQDQIDKFGRHIFKEGDRVLGGYTTYDSSIRRIGVTLGSAIITAAELTSLAGKEITLGTKRAKILKAEKITDNVDGYYFYLKPIGGDDFDNISNNNVFALSIDGGGSINLNGVSNSPITDTENFATYNVNVGGTNKGVLAYAGGVFQDEGVFFIKGHFVHTDAASAFSVKAVDNTGVISKLSGSAVFDITESVVTSSADSSLNDNANGEPNINAPGADRYKISLDLKFIPLDDDNVESGQQRINLLDIKEDGVVNPARTEYGELGKALAERTQEESGSYVLNPFKNEVREYFNDSSGNRGKYTAAEIFNGSEANALLPNVTDTATATTEGKKRFVVGVEPGVAYVQGYRVELEDKQDVVCDKGRESSDEGTETNYKLSTNRGQFIEGSLTDSNDGNNNAGKIEIADVNLFQFAPNKQYKLFKAATGSDSNVVIGTCRIHAIENGLDNISSTPAPTGAQASKRLYIFDIQLIAGKKLKEAKALALDPSATDAESNTVLQNSTGFELKDTGENASRMVYPLGGYDVKEINDTNSKRIVQRRKAATHVSAGVITIAAGTGENFISTDPEDYVIVQANAGTDSTNGETFAKDVTISGTTATIKLRRAGGTTAPSNTDAIVVFYPAEVKAELGVKTQTSSTYTETRTLGHGDIITLNKVDVYSITGVTHDGNDLLPVSDFELFSGQSDTHYGFSQVVYKGSQSLKSAAVVVSFDHYTHTTSGVFAANSYYKSNGSTLVDLEDIPQYEDLKLSNCLDFRQSIEISTEGGETKPNSITNVDFTYYKARRDIIALSQLGELKYVKGNASQNPIYPSIPSDSLILYRIEKPGYLYSLDDLEIDVAKNRRYTMSDIGGLEQRIHNLEYYTALSQLESEATETQINDGDGLPRFKGGIITDSFRGHGVGDTNSSGYRAAIDRDNFTARPMYLSDNARWSYISGMGGNGEPVSSWNGETISTTSYSGKRKNSLTLDFIEKVLVDQPYASDHISVNPYDVATWSGNLELSPSSDEWKDVNNVPEIITNIDGDNSAVIQQIANDPNILGTEWNEWESEWSPARWSFWNRTGRTDTFSTRTRVSRRRRRIDTFRRELREGIQTSLVENFQREVIDDRVLNVTFVPFIRSRKVHFKASMLKPNTTFFLYFDDVNITSYATDDEAFVQFGGEVAAVGGTDVTRYEGLEGPALMSPGATPSINSGIVSDDAGEVDGWFVIPNNDVLRFRTGSRQVRLTDSALNNRVLELSSAESTYHAKGLLETRQQTILSTRQLVLERTRLQERRNVLISSRVVRRDPIAQTFMIGNEPTGIFLSSVDIFFQERDPNLPVELSIVSVENGIPTQKTIPFSRVTKLPGAVIPNATAALATKFMFDTPVYLQPGVEYAIVLISNSARYRVWHAEVGGTDVGTNAETINKNVNMGVLLKSQNASTWTPDQNKDLKFTLNRADFKTTSQTGLFTGLSPQRGQVTYINVTNGGSGYLGGPPKITIGGVTSGGATSENQATAKAFIKKGGVIDYIEVVTNGAGYTSIPDVVIAAPSEISIKADDTGVDHPNNRIILPSNVLEAVNGQQFTYKKNGGNEIGGLTDGDTYHALTVDSNGNEVSHSHLIQLRADNSGSPGALITLTDNGGAPQTLLPVSTATAEAQRDVWKASAYLPIIQDMLLPEVSVDYTLNDSATDAYTVFPGELIYTGKRVTHDFNSGHGESGIDQLKLQAELTTTDSKISPVVDLDRISLVTFDNIVNDSNEFETTEDDGQCAARYITKSVKLENPSDQVDVYFDAVRPDESTSIEVYARFGDRTSGKSFDAIPWTKIETDSIVPVSSNYQFGEVHYEGSSNDGEEFDQVAIKILFRSSNLAYVPEIKNLRIIASL